MCLMVSDYQVEIIVLSWMVEVQQLREMLFLQMILLFGRTCQIPIEFRWIDILVVLMILLVLV